MPNAVTGAAAAVLGSTIYVMGGYNGGTLDTVYSSTDPDGAGWTTEATTLPVTLQQAGVVTFNSKIFLIGGFAHPNVRDTV